MGLELDLGCGKQKHQGAIGLDKNWMLGKKYIDACFYMKEGNELPFRGNFFDKVYLYHILEHVDNIPWCMSEIHRVSKPNAAVSVEFPHFSWSDSNTDVTHKRALGLHSMDYFDSSTKLGQQFPYYMDFNRRFPYKINKIQPIFPSFNLGIFRQLYNLFGMDKYEMLLARFFPISAVNVEMRVLK